MLASQVGEALSRVTLAPWYRNAGFKVEEYPHGLANDWASVRFRIEYLEPDTETGELELQCGRWWYVERDTGEEALVKMAWAALTMSDEHRRREGFSYDGYRIFDPHRRVTLKKE